MIGPNEIKPYSVDNLYTYFLDRNPDFFTYVLDHLRNDSKITVDSLPDDVATLKNIAF